MHGHRRRDMDAWRDSHKTINVHWQALISISSHRNEACNAAARTTWPHGCMAETTRLCKGISCCAAHFHSCVVVCWDRAVAIVSDVDAVSAAITSVEKVTLVHAHQPYVT